jgi:hypothetical protein
MKKIKSLGRSLSKGEQKNVIGGTEEPASCTVYCTCGPTQALRASCWSTTTSCSATDESGITCDGQNFSCVYLCANY